MAEQSTVEIRPLTGREFGKIQELAHRKFGLELRSGKEELVAARLGKHLRRLGFRTFGEYFNYVLEDHTGTALTELIDALTTNYTTFLREPAHFDFLREVAVREFGGKARLDIWCAASATGEEPYTIAATLLEAFEGRRAPAMSVLASDISTKALATAERAVYPEERFHGTPEAWVRRYFLRGQGDWAGQYRPKPAVRNLVTFRRLNLTESFPPALPVFSVIFCRNVMIYFDRTTQEDVVERLSERLEPGGYLLTGHSESLLGGKHTLEYVCPAVYRKPARRRSPA